MAEVAAFFGWNIPFNGKIDEDDLNLLILLLSIVRGTPIPIDYLTATIRKGKALSNWYARAAVLNWSSQCSWSQ